MTNLELCDFIVKHNIRSEKELYAIANQRRVDGEQDLAEYVTKFPKKINENISSAWKLHNAAAEVKRNSIPRMERVKIAATESCVPTSNGQWYECATQVLRKKWHTSCCVCICCPKASGRRKRKIQKHPHNRPC